MKRNVIIAVAAAAAVIGGGTLAGAALGSDEAQADRSEQTAQTAADFAPADTDDTDDDGSGAAQEPAGSAAERALETALTQTPGVVTQIELDGDDDGTGRAWEVGMWGDDAQWHHVRVSENGTEVLGTGEDSDDSDDSDDENEDNDDAGGFDADSTTIGEAIRAAEDHTSAAVREADLDDGRWHVELRDENGIEYELEIDLTTGEIAEEHAEQAADEATEQGDDDYQARDDDGMDNDNDNDGDDD
jgi:uncharacterized membrane protein YkoI